METYKPMNKCPNCGKRDFFVKDINKNKPEPDWIYNLKCNCGYEICLPQAEVKMGIFINRNLVGYYHWQYSQQYPNEGDIINWETLKVSI